MATPSGALPPGERCHGIEGTRKRATELRREGLAGDGWGRTHRAKKSRGGVVGEEAASGGAHGETGGSDGGAVTESHRIGREAEALCSRAVLAAERERERDVNDDDGDDGGDTVLRFGGRSLQHQKDRPTLCSG